MVPSGRSLINTSPLPHLQVFKARLRYLDRLAQPAVEVIPALLRLQREANRFFVPVGSVDRRKDLYRFAPFLPRYGGLSILENTLQEILELELVIKGSCL